MAGVTMAILLAIGQANSAPKAETAPDGQAIVWRSVGPGGGGWIQSIAWDSADAEILHVGCDVGGY